LSFAVEYIYIAEVFFMVSFETDVIDFDDWIETIAEGIFVGSAHVELLLNVLLAEEGGVDLGGLVDYYLFAAEFAVGLSGFAVAM
jgi:hypothetical protein